MAEPVLIGNDGPVDSPKTYRVPPGVGFVPTAVTARFDGTAAGGSFLPCLTFKSQSGLILQRQYPTEGADSGGDYIVSYRPS